MRLSRLFIGRYEAIRRPVNLVDERLINRIEKARQDLVARGIDVVSVRAVPDSLPKSAPAYVRAVPASASATMDEPVNRAA